MRRWSWLTWITFVNTVLVLVVLLMVLAMLNRLVVVEKRLGGDFGEGLAGRVLGLQLSLSQLGTGTWETIRSLVDRVTSLESDVENLKGLTGRTSESLTQLQGTLDFLMELPVEPFYLIEAREGVHTGEALFHVLNWSQADITVGEGAEIFVHAQSFHLLGEFLPVSPPPPIRLNAKDGETLSEFRPTPCQLFPGDLVMIWYQAEGDLAVEPETLTPAVFWDRESGLAVAILHLRSFEPPTTC